MSGYTTCACPDCSDIAIGEPGEAMCRDCEAAGCDGQACEVDPCDACRAYESCVDDCLACEHYHYLPEVPND
jgi:hypothetical protein